MVFDDKFSLSKNDDVYSIRVRQIHKTSYENAWKKIDFFVF